MQQLKHIIFQDLLNEPRNLLFLYIQQFVTTMCIIYRVAAPEIFLWGASMGQNAKIQKFAKNGLFWPFFSSDWGGQMGGRASDWGENAPHAPPP